MTKIILNVLIVIKFLLAVKFSHELEVKYEMIQDFGPHAEETFERSIHEIVRRTIINSSIPTNGPTHLSKPTPSAKSTGSMTIKTTSRPSATPSTDSSLMTSTTRGLNVTNNISIFQDNHKYYTSQYYVSGANWWYNLDDGGTPKLHTILSKNLQYSETLKISFQFLYYGHLIDKVTVTNKGFLFLGETLHKYNASLQYVAPLMADFAPHLHQDTAIRYVDTGDRFTVEWNSIRLTNQKGGEFSFQCSIFKNGTLVFAYNKIPIPVSQIKNDTFFVRVGLSDGFKYQKIIHGIFFVNGMIYTKIRLTVYYLYHHIQLSKNYVKSGSAFLLTPIPNCISFKTCDSCVKSNTTFSCAWCPTLERCSDGIDRHRQEWILSGCLKNSETTCAVAEKITKPSPTSEIITTPGEKKSGGGKGANKMKESMKSNSGISTGVIFVIILCVAILLVILWVVYAFRRPQSASGMFLMQYGNPRKWSRNSHVGEESPSLKISFKTMSNESIA